MENVYNILQIVLCQVLCVCFFTVYTSGFPRSVACNFCHQRFRDYRQLKAHTQLGCTTKTIGRIYTDLISSYPLKIPAVSSFISRVVYSDLVKTGTHCIYFLVHIKKLLCKGVLLWNSAKGPFSVNKESLIVCLLCPSTLGVGWDSGHIDLSLAVCSSFCSWKFEIYINLILKC